MSNNTHSINDSTIVSLLDDLQNLSIAAKRVREKLLKLMPEKYGSDLWWEKSDNEAIEDIKAGHGKKFKSYEEAIRYLSK